MLAARKRMLFNGVVVGSAVFDAAGTLVGTARVSAPGLLNDEEAPLRRDIELEFTALLNAAPAGPRHQDEAYAESARAGLRRIIGKRFGKRPIVDVHLLRL